MGLLPNPWLILAVVVAFVANGFYWHHAGHSAGYAEHQAEVGRQTAEANARSRAAERQAALDLHRIAERHFQESQDAKVETDRLRAELRAGTRRLSIPVAGRLPACANFAAAPGAGAEARAELDPAAAERIVAITDDGDAAIRQLNAVIDAYGVAERTCGQAPQSP